MASGVIPTKGGRNGPVPATPGRAPQGRWRSSPWKRCNHAAPRGRVREHPAPLGALRRRVMGETPATHTVREHPAPLGALRQLGLNDRDRVDLVVREHPAPLGALRPKERAASSRNVVVREHPAPLHYQLTTSRVGRGDRLERARTGRDLVLWRLPRTWEHFVQSGTFCAQSDLDWLLCAQSVTLCTKCSPVHRMFPYTQFSVMLRMLVPSSVGAWVNESARSR